MCFACIAAVLKITVARGLYHTNIKIVMCYVCMHGIHMFDRNVWFANCLAILYQDVGNRAIYLRISELKFFPLLYILLLNCHQYQIHCSMTILHTYTVCYSYITVGVSALSLRKSVNSKDILQLATVI